MPRQANTSPQTVSVLTQLLTRRDAWHYGYALARETGLPSGTLYPILIRLAEQGWLQTKWTEPDRPGVPPRHTYRLTHAGARAAAERIDSRPRTRAVLRARTARA
jgi:PadR family transcriptional regulator, regulatory protein PadR